MTDDVLELVAKIPDAPLDKEKNARFRAKVFDRAADDERFRRAILIRTVRDPVFFVNTFGVCQAPKDYGEDLHIPVVLFPRQVEFVRLVAQSIDRGEPLLVAKSREQLATIGMAHAVLWKWLFFENANVKIGSRVRELVDGKSYSDQILPKMDYILERLPPWMLPEGYTGDKPYRTFLNMLNPVTRVTIRGEATNKHFGVSGRYALVWLDEVTKIPVLETIHAAVSNTTNCYVYTATPDGWEFFADLVHGGNIRVFKLHWSDNAIWTEGGTWRCKSGCPAHPKGGELHSARYDRECQKFNWDRQTIAQELDISFQRSGQTVFYGETVAAAQRFLAEKKPRLHSVRLVWENAEPVPAGPDDRKAWYRATHAWTVGAEEVSASSLRIFRPPIPDHVYCLGGDVGKGKVNADASVAYVGDLTDGVTVACDESHDDPDDCAVRWAMLSRWYNRALCGVEAADQGLGVNRILMDMGAWVFMSLNTSAKLFHREKYSPGVPMTRQSKIFMFTNYVIPAINTTAANGLPLAVIPFPAFWQQASVFVYEGEGDQPKMKGRGKRNDDHVMGWACMCYAAHMQYGRISGVTRKALKPHDDAFDRPDDSRDRRPARAVGAES